VYAAECALHDARRSHNDAWIAAASDKLHRALADYLAQQHDETGRSAGSRVLGSFPTGAGR
jgi:hypothetical protein